jgi:peptide/nickel transport system substrate-binding protein
MDSDFSVHAADASATRAREDQIHVGDPVTKRGKLPHIHVKDVRRRQQRVIKLLKRAGWVIKNGVCVSEKTGRPLEITLLLEGDDRKPEAIAYARNLKAFGITLIIRSNDATQYWRRVLAFDYQMVALKWTGSSSPGVEQRNRWTTESAEAKGSLNFAGVRDVHVDKAVRMLLGAQTYEDQQAATRALDRKLLWRYLVVPLGHPGKTCLLHAARLKFVNSDDLRKIPEKSFWWDETALN